MDALNTKSVGLEIPAAPGSGDRRARRLPRSVSLPVLGSTLRAFDFGALLSAAWLVDLAQPPHAPGWPHGGLLAGMLGGVAAAYVLHAAGTYRPACLLIPRRQVLPLLLALSVGFGVFLLAALAGRDSRISPATLGGWMAGSLALMAASRLLLHGMLARCARLGRLRSKVAVVGDPARCAAVAAGLRARPDVELVGLYDDKANEVAVAEGTSEQIRPLAELLGRMRSALPDRIVVAISPAEDARVVQVRQLLGGTTAHIHLVSDAFWLEQRACSRLAPDRLALDRLALDRLAPDRLALDETLLFALDRHALSDWKRVHKGLFDRAVASLGLLLTSPLLLAIAVAIKIDSPGPVLFRQPRIGLNNRVFRIYKFRTMHTHMEDLLANRQTTPDDPRITPLGRHLRKLSLDELPQLLNVLLGDMSMVGPRPHAPNTKAGGRLFEEVTPAYASRHCVKPGITGWAQVNGWRGETRTEEQLRKRVEFDLEYIRTWSLVTDVKIIWLTVLREIVSPNAF